MGCPVNACRFRSLISLINVKAARQPGFVRPDV
jgi:hypothetical protein